MNHHSIQRSAGAQPARSFNRAADDEPAKRVSTEWGQANENLFHNSFVPIRLTKPPAARPLRFFRLCGAPSLSFPNLWVLLLFLALRLSAAEPRNTSAIVALKPGPGREQVQINCIPCHSTAIITATHATRERWDELITTMQQRHGLWPLIPTIRKQLLDYLAATQPPSDPGLEAGKQTPWAQPLYRPNPLW